MRSSARSSKNYSSRLGKVTKSESGLPIRKWTVYPDHHQSGLESSGFQRVSVTTYLTVRQLQWIETQKAKIGDMLPEIIGSIMAAGPILERMKREREESERQYREKEARRAEALRLRQIDENCWQKFGRLASNWEERERLLAFIAEIERCETDEGEITVADRSLSDWIAWAKKRTEALNPLRQGVAGMFQAIANVSQWS